MICFCDRPTFFRQVALRADMHLTWDTGSHIFFSNSDAHVEMKRTCTHPFFSQYQYDPLSEVLLVQSFCHVLSINCSTWCGQPFYEWIKLWYVSCCWGRHPYIYTHTRKPTGAKHGRLLWFIVCTNDRLADRHLYIGFMISAHLPSLWEIARETFHAIFRSGLWQRLCAGSQPKTTINFSYFCSGWLPIPQKTCKKNRSSATQHLKQALENLQPLC